MTASRKKTILAVDDDQKTRQLLKQYLEIGRASCRERVSPYV